MDRKYRLVDLFAGCGGLSLGMEQAGFTVSFANEIDKTCAKTYLHNRNISFDQMYVGDIRELVKNTDKYSNYLSDIDIVCGGPPCQGFSTANRQRVLNDPRNILYKSYLEFLSIVRPKFFVMENVRGMLNKIDEILGDFREVLHGEYDLAFNVFNSKDFGVPQNRNRLIVIGNRVGVRSQQIIEDIIKYSDSLPKFNLYDAIADLPELSPNRIKGHSSEDRESTGYTSISYSYTPTEFYKYINNGRTISTLYNHKNRFNNDRDIEIFSRLPQGGDSLHDSISEIMPYKNRNHMFKDKYYKLVYSDVSKTITSHMKNDCNMYIHPTQARGLSPREAARIQTFPDDFEFLGSRNSWYKQVGNAVPVKLAEAIGHEIIKYLKHDQSCIHEPKTIRHLELFAGIGGFRQAITKLAEDTGIHQETVGFSEIDEKAIKTYKANFETEGEVEIGDIASFNDGIGNIESLPDFDLLTGGFPCQPFSMMGQQLGFEDNRGNMFFRIMEIIKKKLPKYVLLENVRNIRTHDNGNTLRVILQQLNNAGYQVFYDIFDTSEFYLPQRRQRIYIFATTEDVPLGFEFTSEKVSDLFWKNIDNFSLVKYKSTHDLLRKNVDDKYYLSERIKPTILSGGTKNYYSKPEINQLIGRPLTATMTKMHRACQDNYFSDDFIKCNDPDNFVLQKSSFEELITKRIRKLTPEEALLMQGFDSEFCSRAQKAGVGDCHIYKQAGNAVSVNTVYAVIYYIYHEIWEKI